MSSQFSPMTGPFHSPEGYPGIGSHPAVYEHHARRQIVDKALALLFVVCPGTGSQSKAAVVRNSNRVIEVCRAKHARHRTKQLLLVRRRALGDICQHRGSIKIPRTIQRLAPGQDLGQPLDRPGNFYAPTVLTNIPKGSPAHQEELFGPVASVFRAADLDDAIRIANDSRFGLGASAWTNDKQERERFINDLESGMVFINRMVASDPRIPFGGVKWSGHGRELGAHGIREFTNIKTVWIEEAP